MTTKEFHNLYNAMPFRPFTIHLADGRDIPVRHQEFVALSPVGRTVIVYQPDGSFDVVDLMLATSLRVHGKKASS